MSFKFPVCRARHESIRVSPVWWLSHGPNTAINEPHCCYTATLAEKFLLLLKNHNPSEALVSNKLLLHFRRSLPTACPFFVTAFCKSSSLKSLHLSRGVPPFLAPSTVPLQLLQFVSAFVAFAFLQHDHTTLAGGIS